MENGFKACGSAKPRLEEGAVAGFLRALKTNAGLIFYKNTDSTNLRASELLRGGEIETPFAVVAASQSAGRGRFGRVWRDAEGASICLTCGFSLKETPPKLAEKFSMLAGCFIAKNLALYGGADIKIKWPNDLYCRGKKLGGMIGEAILKGGKLSSMYFGAGVNFAKIEDFEGGSPISLEECAVKEIDINEACAIVVNSACAAFEALKENADIDISKEFEKLDYLRGRRISVSDFSKTQTGIARGVNGRGELRLELENGETVYCGAGEATVLKNF